MIRIAICDDDLLFVQKLSLKIQVIFEKHHINYDVAIFQSGEQLLDAGYFDIILLDIQMGVFSGIDTAKKLREQGLDSYIVFLTSHKKYVFSAFDVAATHYLLKPVDWVKLEGILCNIIKKLACEKENGIKVKNGTTTHFVPFSEISYVEIYGRKVSLHTQKDTYTFNGRLDELEKSLPENFFRCHKSYILSLSKVTAYNSETAMMKNGVAVPIARRKHKEFGKVFLTFLREKEF